MGSLIRRGIVGLVGRTPMVRLNRISEETGCEILAKCEFASAGGSIKDRVALYLIKDAEKKGLKSGGTIVEGTTGNTGIGLAHISKALGYKCIIFMPNTQSQEKIDCLATLGAEVRAVPAVPYADENNYHHHAKRCAETIENCVYTNQLDNTASTLAHIETTGPEIWEETDGKVDAVVFGSGSAGTIAGSGIYLKEKNRNVQVILADPDGSMLYNYFKHGKFERTGTESITEGVGQSHLTNNFKQAPLDDAMNVPDIDAVNMTFRLLHEEGLFVGASSGLNVSAAVRVAKTMGPGHTIVTALCDGGQRYYNKLFSREELKKRGLLDCIPEEYQVSLH